MVSLRREHHVVPGEFLCCCRAGIQSAAVDADPAANVTTLGAFCRPGRYFGQIVAMLQLRNRAGFDVAAVIPAGAGLFPFFRLRGRLRSGPFVPVVARGRNYAVAGTEDFVADLAMKRKLPGSRSGTGRSRFDFSFLPGLFGSMAERSEDGILQIDLTFPCRIGEVQSAAAAGPVCSISRFGARCGFGIGADQGMGMLEHGNHSGLHVLPVMSAEAPLLAFLSLAGRFHHDPLAPVMTERFNPFVTGAEDFSAHPAVQFKALIARFRLSVAE